MKTFLLLMLTLFSSGFFPLKAAVWEDTEQWSLEKEKDFSTWINSSAVHDYMFVSPGSPYFGINVDCADASYALRAIFSFENKLPFAIVNPSGSRGNTPTLNNRMNNWNRFPEGVPRLIAMINEISLSVGTDNLAYLDTYPIALNSISPGTIFVSKLKVADDYYVKHALNIKGINPVGTLDVIYSSENIQAIGAPMQRRKDKMIDSLPSDPFGFRKFRWPGHLGVKVKSLPEDMRPSLEQFELARTLGIDDFVKLLKKTIGTVEESHTDKIKRSLNTICLEAQARIEVVNQANKKLEETSQQCMDFRDYDIYSTPARDASLKEAFFSLQRSYFETEEMGELDAIEDPWLTFAENILIDRPQDDDSLQKWCAVQYKSNQTIDLAELWKRVYFEKISSHPNDPAGIRWGEEGERTSCKRWY